MLIACVWCCKFCTASNNASVQKLTHTHATYCPDGFNGVTSLENNAKGSKPAPRNSGNKQEKTVSQDAKAALAKAANDITDAKSQIARLKLPSVQMSMHVKESMLKDMEGHEKSLVKARSSLELKVTTKAQSVQQSCLCKELFVGRCRAMLCPNALDMQSLVASSFICTSADEA